MEFDGAVIKFNVNKGMKHPNNFSSIFAVNSSIFVPLFIVIIIHLNSVKKGKLKRDRKTDLFSIVATCCL